MGLDDVVINLPPTATFGNCMANVKHTADLLARNVAQQLRQIPEACPHVLAARVVVIAASHSRLFVERGQFFELRLKRFQLRFDGIFQFVFTVSHAIELNPQ